MTASSPIDPPMKPRWPGNAGGAPLRPPPKTLAAMVLPPRIIVVVVHHVGDFAADDPAHALDHPFTAGIGVAPGELHRRDVAPPDLAVLVDHGGPHAHSAPCPP